ncbi:hypothetical protein Sulfitobl28_32710 (plasmid) [Sulfitobacter pontiacus]|nr:hypothetical protein Sulfitobl28_32710 [Sulfitobacter pontiacus]
MSDTICRIDWAERTISAPLVVKAGGRRVRSNNCVPISASSAAICWLTAEAVRFTACAAAAKPPCWLMANKVSS